MYMYSLQIKRDLKKKILLQGRQFVKELSLAWQSGWLRHYIANRKVAISIPDKVIEFFSIYLALPASLWP
jgi:hypothetical protein